MADAGTSDVGTPALADDVVAAARASATAAADASGVRIGDLHTREHLEAASALFDTVWGRDASAGSILAPEMLRAMEHAGCQVTGAFDADDHLVGATAALVGLEDGVVFLHSHVTGIAGAVRGRGIGWALKQYQRSWCLSRGIRSVRWTFDPLVRRNALFNLVKLAAQPVAYLDDVYGPMRDARNAGMPTDRLVAHWQLDGARVLRAATGAFAEPRLEGLRRAGAVETLRDEDGEPVRAAGDGAHHLVQVPADIEAIRRDDPERAGRWAHAVREVLGGALRGGYRVTGFTRDGWYVLARDDRVEELA